VLCATPTQLLLDFSPAVLTRLRLRGSSAEVASDLSCLVIGRPSEYLVNRSTVQRRQARKDGLAVEHDE
jgi:hypothetical protein